MIRRSQSGYTSMANDANLIQDGAHPDRRRPRHRRRLQSGVRSRPKARRETKDWRETGRSEPNFPLPSLAPGVDYTVPVEADIKQALDRVRGCFERSTAYGVIDTASGQPITDFSKPTKTVGIDLRKGEFNDWTYSMGVVYAGMLRARRRHERSGVPSSTLLKNFDFIFDHIDFFRRQTAEFGPQSYGYRRLPQHARARRLRRDRRGADQGLPEEGRSRATGRASTSSPSSSPTR